MANLPKIVRARLQRVAAGPPQDHHPDADLLTAFAEQSLKAAEREHVMEHLARCGNCREVVALALPGTELTAVPRLTHAGHAWLNWPALRWGVVTAGIFLIGSVGILLHKQSTQQSAAVISMPAREQKTVTAPSQTAEPAAPASARQALVVQAPAEGKQAPTRNSVRRQSPAVADQQESSKAVSVSRPTQQETAGGGSAGGVFRSSEVGSGAGRALNNNPVQTQTGALAASAGAREAAAKPVPQSLNPQTPSAAASQQVEVSGANQVVEVQPESAQIAAQNQEYDKLAKNQMELPAQKQPLNNLDVVKAKDSTPPQTDSSAVFAPMVSSSSTSLQMLAWPRWAISSSGALQRSFDAGQTWEKVNVTEFAVAGHLKADITSAYETSVQDKKIKRNRKAESNAGIVFRALAAMGSEVWVGGSGTALYRSLDSGAHWARVLPTEANASLSGDVTGVELSDPDHARVATSTGELWITANRGQTWHKQQ